jgi:hypothetical protein
MKVLIFSLLFFSFSPLLFSETLTSEEIDAIVRVDSIRANTERSIILTAGQLANKLAPSKAKFYINFMRAYAWVMNDMHTGTNTVYNLGSYYRNLLQSTGIPLDTNMVTGALLAWIVENYEADPSGEAIQSLIMLFNFADNRIESITSEDDPIIKGWMEQAKEAYRKIITLANQLQ